MSKPGQISFTPLRWALLILFLCLAAICLYLGMGWVHYYRLYEQYASGGMTQLDEPVRPEEAIVVLTGDPHRIPKALALLRQRGSPLLIISGTGKRTTLTDLVNQQGDAAVNIHEIWKKIRLETKSTSTIENAEETAKLVRQLGIQRLILVTSDYHMPRSLLIFHRFLPGIEILPYPAPTVTTALSGEERGDGDKAWHIAVEYLKYFVFTHFVLERLEPGEETISNGSQK